MDVLSSLVTSIVTTRGVVKGVWFFCGLADVASPGPGKELIRFRSSISYSDKPVETSHSCSNHEISDRFDNFRMSVLE
jgi:hypothetical protein